MKIFRTAPIVVISMALAVCGSVAARDVRKISADWTGSYRFETKSLGIGQPNFVMKIRASAKHDAEKMLETFEEPPIFKWVMFQESEPEKIMPLFQVMFSEPEVRIALTNPDVATPSLECLTNESMITICRTDPHTAVSMADVPLFKTPTGIFAFLYQTAVTVTPLD